MMLMGTSMWIDETEALLGVCKLFQGILADEIHLFEKVISKAEKEGYKQGPIGIALLWRSCICKSRRGR